METTIVVGVDPTPAGASALRWALREAQARGVELSAVRAWSPTAFGAYYALGTVLPEAMDESIAAKAVADEQLALAVQAVPGGAQVSARAVALMGSPAQVLVDAARQAALLVVGSRGAGMLSRAVLGSVSSVVLHHAVGAVAVVPELPEAAGAGSGVVVVGVDHSEPSRAALRFGVEHARRRGWPLVPVFVQDSTWAQGPPGAPVHDDVLGREAYETKTLAKALSDAGADGLDVRPEVLRGQAATMLTELAGPDDVLVLGSRGRGGFASLMLGSTSMQCAQYARGPVVVVRA